MFLKSDLLRGFTFFTGLFIFGCPLVFAQEIKDIPQFDGLEVIHHTHYSLGFSDKHKQAMWVGYRLDKSELLGPHKRKNNFRVDPSVSTGSATNADYAKSGYDRGHLMPAEDATFSDLAMSETFYFSNMSPQLPSLNRGQWSALENAARVWAFHFDSLYIFTAPLLNDFIDSIGFEKRIPVPKYFYKVLYAFTPADTHCIAFLVPHEKLENFRDYAKSINYLETLSGINFFPKTVNQKHESKVNKEFWFSILEQTVLPNREKILEVWE